MAIASYRSYAIVNMRCFNIIQHLASIFDPDHLCFEGTIYDNVNGPSGTIYVIIIGPARPLMYPGQISCYRFVRMEINFVLGKIGGHRPSSLGGRSIIVVSK